MGATHKERRNILVRVRVWRCLIACVTAASLACTAAINAAAPAHADYLYLSPSTFGRYNQATSTGVYWSSTAIAPGAFYYTNASSTASIELYEEMGREGYYFSASSYTSTDDLFAIYYSYTGLITSTTTVYNNVYFPASFYVQVRVLESTGGVSRWGWRSMRCEYVSQRTSTINGRSYVSAHYQLPDQVISGTDYTYFFLSPDEVPVMIWDDMNGTAEVVSGLEDVEEALDENTTAVEHVQQSVEENTEAIEEMHQDIMSTEGSDSVVSSVVGDSEEGWLCERLGFICTITQVPISLIETVFTADITGELYFPEVTLPYLDLTIGGYNVSPWTIIPSGVQTTLRIIFTLIAVILWVKGMLSLFRRFTGEEQTVQVENTGVD